MRVRTTPALAAAVYLGLGILALFFSDVVFVVLVDDPAILSQLQATKGVVEIVLTTGFIYVVMVSHERSLRASVEKSRERAQELAVLHRVFRHNLRNKINVVLGHAREAQADTSDPSVRPHLETIIEQISAVSKTAEQAVTIERLSFSDDDLERVDVVGMLAALVEEYEATTSAEFELSTPPAAWVWASTHLRVGLEELLDNAVVHNDAPQARVRVTVEPTDETTRVTIADNGPGIPEGTQRILESTDVDPRNHLTTFGLWTAYWVVTRSGGRFAIDDNDSQWCRITLSLDTAPTDD